MEVKDLMIGDYVNYRGQIIKVTSLYDKGGSNEVGWTDKEFVWVNAASVEPIPITSEILEKNGWKNISDHTLKGCETFRLHIEQGSFDYTLTLKLRDYFRFDSYDDRVYTLCEVNFGFKYVHELQHALRLCGITKEIEL